MRLGRNGLQGRLIRGGLLGLAVGVLVLCCGATWAEAPATDAAAADAAEADAAARAPVLVELFTSEGCSSCPPADKVLELMNTEPFPDLQLVVLGEHVDYWDQEGWRDKYSLAEMTARQKLYQERLHFPEAYTPQMIIDGTHELNGSDRAKVGTVLKAVAGDAKTPVRITAVSVGPKAVSAHVESDAFEPAGGGRHGVGVFAAVALNHVETDVKKGENRNQHLTHTGVVRSLTRVASLQPGKALNTDIKLNLNQGDDAKNLRVVVFLQDESSMRVYGAAMRAAE